jgi:hypothetical protein
MVLIGGGIKMAYYCKMFCLVCGKEFNSISEAAICPDCVKRQEQKKKKAFLDNLRNDKDLEQRVCQLEELMYNQVGHEHFDIRSAKF